jgi:hypothetical protein
MMQNGQVFPYMHANANHLLAFEKRVVGGGGANWDHNIT